MAKVERRGFTLWRVYQEWVHKTWQLESQGVEATDKTVYFERKQARGHFTDFNYQKPVEDVKKLFGTSPEEARQVVIARLTAERNALIAQVNTIGEDILAISALRDPIEEQG